MTTCAVIPVKALQHAKKRLAGVLSAEERAGLSSAMIGDLLQTLTVCRWVDDVLVVTRDEAVAALVKRGGARVLPEPDEPGLINAVTEAGRTLAREQVERMIFVPADVPLISLGELSVILAPAPDGQGEEPEVTVVPATDLDGSNCIVCAPPDCIPFGFGVGSFRRHLQLARDAGIVPKVLKLPGIGLDVDTPADLLELIAFLETNGVDSGTHHYLRSSGIIARLTGARADSRSALQPGSKIEG